MGIRSRLSYIDIRIQSQSQSAASKRHPIFWQKTIFCSLPLIFWAAKTKLHANLEANLHEIGA